MPPLATDLRRQLENTIINARDLAETVARAALQRWAVDTDKPFGHFSLVDKAFRKQLRARGIQAGDRRHADGRQEIDQLTQELAYECWHRMLFARFLAENHLLMHPDGVVVTLAECEELAPSERAPNGFALAARYASRMLPQIFRVDDVLLGVEFPVNERLPLEKLLAGLPSQVFTADDSLGWVYQFWQSKKKDEVNKSGQKIDGRTLPAVTQLFTEHYMVEFLLHNTIGAWWCGQHGINGPAGGAGVPEGQCPVRLDYLRWKDDGTPAAGTFEGWSKTLREFTMLDPCCGSGHFLVAGFHLLAPLRMHDERLSAKEAVDAVLRENLFGLEIDPRCTQIAAFALAMAAWKFPDEHGEPLGYRPLPPLNIACSGQGVVGTKEQWTRFADGDSRFKEGMERLYDLFQKAPTLGSLIDPRTVADDLFTLGFDALKGTLDRALKKTETKGDPDRSAVGVAAQGIALAASFMTRECTLVATNVPYLARGKQAPELRDYIEEVHPAAKADLATAFVERCLEYCLKGGTAALVTPQNWLFLGSYKVLRERLLRRVTWNVVAKLGPGAFETISGEVVNVALLIHTLASPDDSHEMLGVDASEPRVTVEKARLLVRGRPVVLLQNSQVRNPDSRVALSDNGSQELLSRYAVTYWGQGPGDYRRFYRCFWEVGAEPDVWSHLQSTVDQTVEYGGREQVVLWENGTGVLMRLAEELRSVEGHQGIRPTRGKEAWGKRGVLVSLMGKLPVAAYTGEIYDGNCAALLPFDATHLPAIWCFCKSPEFNSAVRRIDQHLKVTNATLVKVPFDLQRWQQVAAEEYPNGLPEPHSDDPTQWLFKGHPRGSTDPLQIAVARLLGYCWPDQERDDLDTLADKDGIVPIPSMRGEPPAADRLGEVLRTAFGSEWSGSFEHKLLTEAGAKSGTSLDDWLLNSFFEQHCRRFHHRPFVWHVWDGRKDGFACLVNYHKLDQALLETLTYSYLQGWINTQAAEAKASKTGADLRLAAAQALQQKLKLILEGAVAVRNPEEKDLSKRQVEFGYDIFVRWKPLAEQPIGWNPDLNDGVRLNIRPFVEAGILRKNPNLKWTKDRGNEPQRPKEEYPWFWGGDTFRGERVNAVHTTIAEKQSARKQQGAARK